MAAAQTRSAAARNHGNFEPLRNIDNRITGRHATWVVKVLSPKFVEYSFQSKKGEQVLAKKFRCVLTFSNPHEYMYGSVPFDFKNRNAAEEGLKKFTDGSVWEISSPAFDHNTSEMTSQQRSRHDSVTHPSMGAPPVGGASKNNAVLNQPTKRKVLTLHSTN